MRALVDIPDEQVDALARIASAERVSRAALDGNDAFGLWSANEDGLAYQDRVRGEW